MKKIAFLFPGQGSQQVGMGQDLYRADSEARQIFEAADEIAGAPISQLCFNGPLQTLTETVHLQPAVTAVNLACLSALNKAGITCAFSAGHSLGEYSALTAAGVVSVTDALRLVFKRGELMHRESLKHEGAMSAIVGLDIAAVAALVDDHRHKGVVSVANHNAEQQVVITGSPHGVAAVAEAVKAGGARAIPLKVSGAWHSELIKGAEDEFETFLQTIPFESPTTKVIHNVTADTCDDGEAIRRLMVRQLCSPVKWFDTIRRLRDEQVTVFVEVGPGKVLTGLLKKILPPDGETAVYNVKDGTSLERVVSQMA